MRAHSTKNPSRFGRSARRRHQRLGRSGLRRRTPLPGGPPERQRHAERSLALFQQLDDDHGIGASRDELGRLALAAGDDLRAETLFRDVLSELVDGGTEPDTDHNWIEAVEGLA